MENVRRVLRHRNDSGATAVEYGLLVAMIAGVIVGTVILLGDPVNGLYARVRWW